MRIASVFFSTISLFLLSSGMAFAQFAFDICPEDTSDRSFNRLCDLTPDTALPSVFTIILIIAIIVALFYLIWGGLKWITSGGDKGNVETARNHIVAVIIGLILVFLSWFILNFVLQFFFGEGIVQDEGLSLPTIETSDESAITPEPTLQSESSEQTSDDSSGNLEELNINTQLQCRVVENGVTVCE